MIQSGLPDVSMPINPVHGARYDMYGEEMTDALPGPLSSIYRSDQSFPELKYFRHYIFFSSLPNLT